MAREFTKEDLKWIRRFEKVMKDAPSELFLFVGSGIAVYPERVMKANGGVDSSIDSVGISTPMEFDGGDY